MRFFLAIILVFVPAVSSAESIKHQGIDRWYHLFEAGLSAGESAPLVVNLHGYRPEDSAIAARSDPKRSSWPQMERLARIQGFRILHPLAWKGRWSLFDGIKNAALEDGTPIDDVGFVHKLVSQLINQGLADSNQVYLTGLSDGGIMTFRLLCNKYSPFAAGAPVIGFMRESHLQDCREDRPPPILVIAGTLDRILPYDGWLYTNGRYLSIPETTEFWRKRYDCRGQKWELLDDLVEDDQSRVMRIDWNGCAREGAVRLYRVEGGGHQAPSFSPPTSEWAKTKAGPRNRDIESADHIWSFFQEFPRIE
ncbi:MAG: hypothetical protein AAGC81_04485 [Pseudomonadota bacterium]